MASKVLIQLVDDLDGTEIDDGQGETVKFGLDGQTYEIDLSTNNAEGLREVLSQYVGAGRRVGRTTKGGRRSSSSSSAGSGASAAEIREWARANGHTVPDRGRIPQEVRDAFDKR